MCGSQAEKGIKAELAGEHRNLQKMKSGIWELSETPNPYKKLLYPFFLIG